MSFSWTQFFLLAEELSGATVSTSCGTEAKFRSAVSRAYYSAFCEARNYLISRGVNLSGQTPEIHKRVREEFRRRPNQTSRKIGADLNRLRIARNHADYDDTISGNLHSFVRSNLALAQGTLQSLQMNP